MKRIQKKINGTSVVQPLRGLQPLTSLSKGLNLLLKLREAKEPMRLSEISLGLGLNKVTALRLLVTLEKFRFIEKDLQLKKYRIGTNAFYVGSGFIAEGIQKKVFQIMRQVVQDLKHTITLSVLDGVSVLFVARVDGTERVKVTVDIGSRTSAHSSAAGKTILAGLSDVEIIKYLKQIKLARTTASTLTSIESVMAEIAKIRICGFAVNNEESTEGLIAIAVPIKNQSGDVVAALGAAFPAGFLKNKEEQEGVATRLRLVADEMGTLGIRNSKEISHI